MSSKAFELVEEKYKQSKDKMLPRHALYNDLEDLFLSHIGDDKYAWKSKVALPFAYELVMQFQSHLFNSMPRGRFMAKTPDESGDVEVINPLLAYQFGSPDQNFLEKIKKGGLDMALFGSKFYTLHWRRVTEMIDGKNVVVWNAPFVRPLYIYDVFPDLSATDIHDMEFFIHDDYVSMEELEATNRLVKGRSKYKNLGRLKRKIKGEESLVSNKDSSRRFRMDQIRDFGNTTKVAGRIKIRRYYSKKRFITIVPDYNEVIQDGPNPYHHGELPVHLLSNTSYENQLLGIGEIEPIIRILKAANNYLNQHLDNAVLRSYNLFQVKKNSLEHANTWKLTPGGKWVVNEIGDIQPLTAPDATSATFQQALNMFRDEIIRASGAFDAITRQEKQGERTAREVDEMARESNARRKSKESTIDAFITRLYTQALQLNQQFITEKEVVRITDEDAVDKLTRRFPFATEEGQMLNEDGTFKQRPVEGSVITDDGNQKFSVSEDGSYGFLQVEPSDIAGAYDFVVDVGSTIAPNSTKEMNQKLEAYELLKQSGEQVDTKPLLEDILRGLGVKNIEEIFQTQQQLGIEANESNIGSQQFEGSSPLGAGAIQPAIPVGGSLPLQGVPGSPGGLGG